MTGNRCVVYAGPGKVEVHDIGFPELALPEQNRKCEHGVILKVVSTNICGSDQHMVRGRTTAPHGQTLGHEITGEVIEVGRDVEFIKMGDLCSVPFNIACGRCTGPAPLTATWTWAAGRAARLSTSWCPTPTSTC
jgi:glutathione-independent formaldehyde dehydrogenase